MIGRCSSLPRRSALYSMWRCGGRGGGGGAITLRCSLRRCQQWTALHPLHLPHLPLPFPFASLHLPVHPLPPHPRSVGRSSASVRAAGTRRRWSEQPPAVPPFLFVQRLAGLTRPSHPSSTHLPAFPLPLPPQRLLRQPSALLVRAPLALTCASFSSSSSPAPPSSERSEGSADELRGRPSSPSDGEAEASTTSSTSSSSSSSSEPPPPPPPSPPAAAAATGWHALLGLAVVGGVVGVGVWLYLSRYSTSRLLRRLEEEGPSALFVYGEAVQPWELSSGILSTVLLPQVARDERYLIQLVRALEPSAYILEVQRTALNALGAMAQSETMRPALYHLPHLYTSLYDAAMRGNNKEVTQMCFMLLKTLLEREEKGDEAAAAQREEMIAAGALTGLSRATRAWQPEVSGAAGEALGALVPSLTERHLAPLNGDERRSAFDALSQLGALYQENGLSSLSVHCFRLALLIEPHNAAVQTRMGMEQLKLGLKDAALATLKKASKADPSNGETAFHLYKTLLSDPVQDQEGRLWEEAVEPLRRAVAVLQAAPPLSPTLPVHPTLSPAYHLLCKVLEHLGRVPEAVDAAFDWRLYCPSEAVAYFTHGRLLVQQKRWEEGKEALTIAQQLDHSKPQTLYQLALAHYKQGHTQQAKELVQEALRMASSQDPALFAALQSSPFSSAASAAASSSPSSVASPSSPPPLPPTTASLLYRLDWLSAKLAQRSGEPSAALFFVNRILAYRPSDHAALVLRAECLQDSGGHTAAYTAFADSLRQLREQLLAEEQRQQAKKTSSKHDPSNLPSTAALLASSNATGGATSASGTFPLPFASPLPAPSSATLSAYLSSHPHTTAVLSSIGEACKKELGKRAAEPATAASGTPPTADPTRTAFNSMCASYEQLHSQHKQSSVKS